MKLVPQALTAVAVVAGVATPAAWAEGASEPSDAALEILVTGRAARLYRAEEATIGRVASDPLEIPQSVTLVTRQLFEDQGARDVTDLYRNIAGVTQFSYSGVTFRGFRQDEVVYDQLRGDPFSGFTVPQLFTVERVEVLKGPSGMLFGPGAPGGLINYVSRVPADNRQMSGTAALGTFGLIGGRAEAGGPIDRDGIVRARAAGFYEDRNDFRVNAGLETLILDAGVAIRLIEGTELIVQVTHTDQTAPGNRLRGVPTDDAGNFLVDISWNHNEPIDFLALRATSVQVRVESRLSDRLAFDLRTRFLRSREQQQYHEPFGLLDTDGDGRPDTTRRQFRNQMRPSRSQSFAGNLVLDLGSGTVRHRILAGVDHSSERGRFFGRSVTAGVPNLSLAAPVYGLTDRLPYRLLPRTLSSDTSGMRTGLYLQDQIAIGERVILLGGVRQDWFDDVNEVTGGSFADSDTTFRFGGIWRPREDVSAYVSWSTSFEPQSIGSQDAARGGPFPPQSGEQVEAGMKSALNGGRIQLSAALYQIRRRNLVQVDPSKPPVNGLDQLGTIGEVRSRGFEIEAAIDVTDNWVFTGNYAYNDTVVTRDNGRNPLGNAVGDRFANAPAHQAGMWTRHQVPAIRTAFAFGLEHVSERLSLSGQRVKPYTVFDASVIHTWGPLKFLLRIDNIFDKRYAASGFIDRTGHFPGAPRTLLLEATLAY